jgi:hypothetical protein
MTSLLLVLSASTITIITSPYPQPAGPLIMPLGASAAVVGKFNMQWHCAARYNALALNDTHRYLISDSRKKQT